MGMTKISYSGYRFPPEIIHQAIWLYLRFTLSPRDVEDLLAERGVAVSSEDGVVTLAQSCRIKFHRKCCILVECDNAEAR